MVDESPRVAGRVLVGCDGSENAAAAARWAADWARRQGQGVTLLAVVPPMPYPDRPTSVQVLPVSTEFVDRVAAAAREKLDTAAAQLRSQFPDVDVATAFLTGHPAATLAELSEAASLTVVGATGVTGLRGALLGGTVAAVLHYAKGSVVVVPAEGGDPNGPVLVGLDIDAHAAAVATAAIEAAAVLGRPLRAVQAWDMSPLYSMDGAPILVRDEPELLTAAEDSLADLTEPAAAAGVAVERVARIGRPQDVLGELAPSACLLVLGRRGYGGFASLLLGSVSRALTLHPQTPTLVVRG